MQEDGAGEEVFCEAVGEGESWGGGEEAGERTGVGGGGGRGGGDCGLRVGLSGGAADVAGQWDSKAAMLEARQPEEAPATKHVSLSLVIVVYSCDSQCTVSCPSMSRVYATLRHT